MKELLLRSLALALAVGLPLAAQAAPATRPQADQLAAKAAAIDVFLHQAQSKAGWTAALDAATQAYGPGAEPVARALNGLAQAAAVSGDTAALQDSADRALKIEQALKTPDEKLLAEILGTLGSYWDSRKDFEQGDKLLQRSRALRARLYGPASKEVAWVDSELGWSQVNQGHVPEGLALMANAVKIDAATLAPTDDQRIAHQLLYAGALGVGDDHKQAEAVLRGTIDAARQLPSDHPRRAMALEAMAFEMVNIGRVDEAGELFGQAVEMRRRIGPPNDLADALAGLGHARLNQDRPEEAEAAFAEALPLFEQSNNPVGAAVDLLNAGTAASRAGDQQLALQRRLQALRRLQSQPKPNLVAVALTQYKLADSYALTGDLKSALQADNAAAPVIRKIRPLTHPQRMGLEINLGWITALAGDPQAGLALARPAALRMEEESRKQEIAQVTSTGVRENAETFGRALRTAQLAGDIETGFHFAQVLIETDAGRAAAAENARAVAGHGALGETLRRRQTLTSHRLDLDNAYLQASADPAKAAEIQAQIKTVAADIAAAEAVLDRDFPNYRALTYPTPIAIADAQARLAPGEALIVPVATDEGLITLALSRDAAVWDRSPLGRREIRRLIARMRSSIDAGPGLRSAVDASGGTRLQVPAFDRHAAFELYQAIFTPRIRAVTDRARIYTLAPSETFSAMPFAMLVTAEPKGSDADPAALRATSWLIRRAAVQVAPSIPSMRLGHEGGDDRGGFFGAGAPELSGAGAVRGASSYFRSSGVDVAAVKGLPSLPGAASELQDMARALGARRTDLLLGAQATEAAVKAADLSHASVVAFATHGLVAGDLEGLSEPALVFTPPAVASAQDDAMLTASEASQLRLAADWVILSACNTAAGETQRSPGYTGLARAFMLAGGRHVLASHWPVRDDAVARLTVDTIRGARHGQGAARALQLAMLKMIDDRSMTDGSDPAVWAPFVVIGR